jgi:hypothetical protein
MEALGVDALHAQVMFFLELNAQGVYVAQIFWGLWLIPLGVLVAKSGFFPKFLSYLLYLAALGYLIDSVGFLLFPSYVNLFLPISSILTIGEVLFMLWVIIRGAKFSEKQ